MNEVHFKRYAQILVHSGVGLRPSQPLYIYGQVAHRRLMALLAEVAYQAGCGLVETRLLDPLQHAALIRHGRLEAIELCYSETQAWLNAMIRHGGAYICLAGHEFPNLWDEIANSHPERHAAYLRGLSKATGGIYHYGLERRAFPWLTAACPTPGWAGELFPDLPQQQAFDRLAELIFRFCYADRDRATELTMERDRLLKARCRRLAELGIREIHVTGGGSDFRVTRPPRARWLGGSDTTGAGQTFFFNMPSEEVYTTPDRRLTEGRLVATRPFRFPGGPRVRDLVLDFRAGQAIDFDASSGKRAFSSWLETDDGARRLGEFALIGEDSAIARSGLFFDTLLLDENPSSHVALGSGFAQTVAGDESMSSQELEDLGVNRSLIHTDIMFGSKETMVVAKCREGEVVLIERGRWAARRLTRDERGSRARMAGMIAIPATGRRQNPE